MTIRKKKLNDKQYSDLTLSINGNAGVEIAAPKMQGWKSREKRVWRAEIPVL